MKLFLINPIFKSFVCVPSLGLGFIGTCIRKNTSCEVEIIEPGLQKLSEQTVLERVTKTPGELIVGLVCYTESRFDCFEFARKVKEARPDCRIVVGGVHADTLDTMILERYTWVDLVTRGEGEETMLKIVRKEPPENIPGLTFRSAQGIKRNDEVTMASDLDRYGCDYALLEPWIQEWKDLEIPAQYQTMVHLPIIVSRGCKFRCSFCGAFDYWRHSFRNVSSEEIVRRMQQLMATYHVGYFRFYDALFLGGDDKRIMEFCRLIKEKNINVKFRIDLRIGTKPETLAALREAGCIVVGFGVESASDKVLKRINKGITRKQIIETARFCRELGYWSIGFFMISMPGEEIEDVYENFSIFNLFNELNLQFFKIHPGTPFYRELKAAGEVNDDVWFDPAKSETEYFYCRETFPSAALSRKQVDGMMFRYYLTPLKLKHYLGVGLIHPLETMRKIVQSVRLPYIGKIMR